ncbi:MAG: hypothetical protein M3068_13065 [Gemmatimonadota bacterium]|nr:hypothetical protein [Gemmatimonadota bacterium]
MREVLFWAAVACCAVAQIAIIRSAVRATPHGDAPDAVTLSRSGRGMEIAWVIIPAIALVAVLLQSWRAAHP